MQTTLRYGGETNSKTLKLHAKQRFPVDSSILLQAHAELDTYVGIPSYLALICRQFYTKLSAEAGVGVQMDRNKSMSYLLRAKKEFLLDESGNLRFNIKGRMNLNKDLKITRAKAAGEFSLYKFEFQNGQDVKVKVGYEICKKVPYLHISENNWTFNCDLNGCWNVKYHL